MCIRDRLYLGGDFSTTNSGVNARSGGITWGANINVLSGSAVSYTHLRAHETVLDLVCRLLLEKKNNYHT